MFFLQQMVLPPSRLVSPKDRLFLIEIHRHLIQLLYRIEFKSLRISTRYLLHPALSLKSLIARRLKLSRFSARVLLFAAGKRKVILFCKELGIWLKGRRKSLIKSLIARRIYCHRDVARVNKRGSSSSKFKLIKSSGRSNNNTS